MGSSEAEPDTEAFPAPKAATEKCVAISRRLLSCLTGRAMHTMGCMKTDHRRDDRVIGWSARHQTNRSNSAGPAGARTRRIQIRSVYAEEIIIDEEMGENREGPPRDR